MARAWCIKPTSALTMTIDGYIINVRGRIGISQTYHVTAADIIAQPDWPRSAKAVT